MTLNLIYSCPETGRNVQHRLSVDDPVAINEYEVVLCPACSKAHFVNRKTGKLLGHERR